MRKRLGSGTTAADSPHGADVRLPHPMLEPPRMIVAGQPGTAPSSSMEKEKS